MNDITLLWASTAEQKAQCFAIRQEVFVEEQHFTREFDATDDTALHLLAASQGVPMATARLFQENGVWVVGRICVRKPFRKLGLGRLLLSAAEQKARELGAQELTLSAQNRAMGFYEKCGYQAVGTGHYEDDCPHTDMKKTL